MQGKLTDTCKALADTAAEILPHLQLNRPVNRHVESQFAEQTIDFQATERKFYICPTNHSTNLLIYSDVVFSVTMKNASDRCAA